MAHFAIDIKNTLGVALPDLRRLAKEIGRDHALALTLWRPGIHDARLLASMIAVLAAHDKKADDDILVAWLGLIEEAAMDPRNFVKKAVNWALRQIGKRNTVLNQQAIECAERTHVQGSKPARWIASDALRELRSEEVQTRIK